MSSVCLTPRSFRKISNHGNRDLEVHRYPQDIKIGREGSNFNKLISFDNKLTKFKELHRLMDEKHKKIFNIDVRSNLPSSRHFNLNAFSPLRKREIRPDPKLPLTQREISPLSHPKPIQIQDVVHLSGQNIPLCDRYLTNPK